jgi:radical SAM protein with 4Fe4S-binding SPASM domain
MRGALAPDNFTSIAGQFITNRCIPRVVVLYHGGEPLLNKHLAHYIRTLKDLGVRKTVITTNASLLSEQRAEELIMAGLDEMKVSFDGESADENNSIRVNGNFCRNAANVKALCRLRKQLSRSNPAIIISNARICSRDTLLTLNNNRQFRFHDSPEYLTKYFNEYRDDISFNCYPAMVWPGYEHYGNLEALFFPIENPKYCESLFETFTILTNGNVVPCCYDLKGELVLGNIYETNMYDVWNGSLYTDLRTKFKEQKYHHFCSKCNVVSPRYLCKL